MITMMLMMDMAAIEDAAKTTRDQTVQRNLGDTGSGIIGMRVQGLIRMPRLIFRRALTSMDAGERMIL
jgi:hypothetical protein